MNETRRNIMKLAGAAGVAGALAGCVGGGNGNGNGDGSVEAGDVDTEDLPEESITVAHALDPQPMGDWHRSALTFKQFMEDATDGRFSVEISGGGALGNWGELIEQNIDGTIEVVSGTAEGHHAPFYPNINVFSIPYLIRSVQIGNHVFDHRFGQEMFEDFREETGMRMLGAYDNAGLRNFSVSSGNEIYSIEDFEGLQIRTMDIEAHQEMVRQLGADPTPIDGAELYQALDQGVVDGQEQPDPITVEVGLYEVQAQIITSGHFYSMTYVHCNEGWFQDLHPHYQQLVREAGLRASIDGRKVNVLGRQRAVEYLSEQIEYHEVDQDFVDNAADATQDAVEEIIRDEVADETKIDDLYEAVAEAEEELGYT